MRALLAAAFVLIALPGLADPVTVVDRRGEQRFDAPPKRVVALDWTVAEQMLDLGITPLALPEAGLYRDWVVNPPLSENVVDLGLRTEPNLELLVSLAPDVIAAIDADPDLVTQLEQIAPVLVWDAFRADHDNLAAATANFHSLATLLGRKTEAEAALAAQEAELDRIAGELAAKFGAAPPPVTAIRLNDTRSVWVYGDNSFPQHVLTRLGFANELPQPASTWGTVQKPLEILGAAQTGIVLAIKPHMAGEAVFAEPLWLALPAVAERRFAEVEPVWSYGGALSLGRTARAMRDALLSLP